MAALGLLPLLWHPAPLPADSLVTTDGELLSGTVIKTATGYTVQTSDGPVDLPAARVKKILYDHPPAEDTSPSASPGSSGKSPDARTLSALIQQGRAAMAAREYPDACDAFKDALAVDPRNTTAARGLGFAYMALKMPSKALPALEIAASAPPLDRSLVLAVASCLVNDHNPMRAVKYLTAYLQPHAGPVDETVLNALGISLAQAQPSSAAKGTAFKDAAKLYSKLNTELESTVSGKRRWGVEWMDSADVDAREKARAAAQKQMDDASSKLQAANSQAETAQAELKESANPAVKWPTAAIAKDQQKLSEATQEKSKAKAEYDAASKTLASLPAPPFPATIVVSSADLFPPSADPAATGQLAGASTKTKSGDVNPADSNSSDTPSPAKPAEPAHLTRYAVAFAVAPDLLVTSEAAIEDATTISITTSDGKTMDATVFRTHRGDGLALLKVDGAKFPCLSLGSSTSGGSLTCYSFPEVDLFNPIARGMDVSAGAQANSWTVRFEGSPRLPGGPLVQDGAVVGVELGDRQSDPIAVPAATLKQLTSLVADSADQSTLTTDPKKAVMQVTAER